MGYVTELKDNGSSLWGVTVHLCAKLPGTLADLPFSQSHSDQSSSHSRFEPKRSRYFESFHLLVDAGCLGTSVSGQPSRQTESGQS